jgi:hypothetical protein
VIGFFEGSDVIGLPSKPVNIYLIWYGDWNISTKEIIKKFLININNSEYLSINNDLYNLYIAQVPYNP